MPRGKKVVIRYDRDRMHVCNGICGFSEAIQLGESTGNARRSKTVKLGCAWPVAYSSFSEVLASEQQRV